MRENLLLHADSESDPDLRWATGFVVPDPVFWFRTRGRSHLVVNALELGRARRQARVDRVVDSGAVRRRLVRRGVESPSTLDVLVAILRERRVRSVTVP